MEGHRLNDQPASTTPSLGAGGASLSPGTRAGERGLPTQLRPEIKRRLHRARLGLRETIDRFYRER